MNSTEESVIDYSIVCRVFFNYITKMIIDEKRIYTLPKYSTKKGVKSIKKSDHNLLILYLNIKLDYRNKSENNISRKEILNYNNEDDFQKYKEITEENRVLVEYFNNDEENFNISSKWWLKHFNNILHKVFKKIKFTTSKNSKELEKLFERNEKLKIEKSIYEILEDKQKIGEISDQINDINDRIADICVEHFLGYANDGIDGFNQPKYGR